MSETTYLEDVNQNVCNNCGAHDPLIEEIKHFDSCVKGSAKYWEEYYSHPENQADWEVE